MRNKNVFNMHKALPCMSWSPKNLYNLWKRTVGPISQDLTFVESSKSTVFQQRWKSKTAVRAYHGDFIPEKVFKRWYLPQTIPDVRPRRAIIAGDDKLDLEEFAKRKLQAKEKEKELEREIEQKGMAPVGSLMFTEVERRLDVFVFRCCFAHSVYEARRLIIHGYVKLNGRTHARANTRLAPGDMVSVDPNAMRFFKPPHGPFDDVNSPDIVRKLQEAEEGEKSVAKAEAESESTAEAKADPEVKTEAKPEPPKHTGNLTPFYLPQFASPWLHIPAYIEVSFKSCSAVYVRHPTARPGYSEIPTPYDADGALMRFAWEWYMQRRPRMRSKSQLARMPEDRVLSVAQAVHRDWTRMLDPGWSLTPHKESEEGKVAMEARRQQRKEAAAEKRRAFAGKQRFGREAAPHIQA